MGVVHGGHMRRLWIVVVLVSVLSGTAIPVHATAPKAGAPCKKVGQTISAGGKKYTCLKSGRKFVWSKGVRVKAAKIEPTASAPAQEPASKSTPITLRQQWEQTGSRALEMYDKYSASEISDPITPIVAAPAPGLPSAVWEPALATMKRTVGWWDRFHQPITKVYFNVGLLSDSKWICDQVASRSQYRGGSYCQSAHDDEGNRIVFVARMYESEGGYTGVRRATISPGASGSNLYQVLDERVFLQTEFFPRIEHEYVHQIQWEMAGPRYVDVLPCWALEGGAEYLGILTAGNRDVERFLFMRQNTSLRGDIGRIDITKDGFKSFLVEATKYAKETDCFTQTSYGVYRDGVLAVEWLTLQLGIAGLLEMFKHAGQTNWVTAVERAFRKPYIDVLDEIAEHMHKEAVIGKQNNLLFTKFQDCDRPYTRTPTPQGCVFRSINRSTFAP
jgi:hypothetical protein